MSKQNQRSNKPSCPHCRNLGLKNDHWLRESADPNSKLMCPVLLKTECKYCHEMGHNVSKCIRLGKKTSMATTRDSSSFVKTIHVDVKVEGPKKMSYSQKEAQLIKVLREKPSVVVSNLGIRVIENPSHSQVANQLIKVLREKPSAIVSSPRIRVIENPSSPVKSTTTKIIKKYTSWADVESSDDDEE